MVNKIKTAQTGSAGKRKVTAKKATLVATKTKTSISKRPATRAVSSKAAKGKAGSLTKEILIKAASIGFAKAAAKTMKVMGYNVIVKDGWVIKKFADGRIEKISRLETNNNPVVLD